MQGSLRESRAGDYAAYLAELEHDRTLRRLGYGIVVVIALNVGFIAIDSWAHRFVFSELLAIRVATIVLLVVTYVSASRIGPTTAMILGCAIAGGGILGVIARAGGVGSAYSPGLMLLLLGMPVLLPITGRQAFWIAGGLTSVLAVIPFSINSGFGIWEYSLYLSFPLASAVECVASCIILDRMRFNEFLQRRALEEAKDHLEDLDRAKSRFTANVHHELRTPLTLMLAPLEAMRSGEFGPLPPLIERTVRTMESNGLRLLKLINNLLDLAKIESDQLKIRRVPVDLRRVAREVVDGALPMAEHKGLVLEVVAPDDLPVIHADPDALEKVLINLVGNALKFTETGSVRVELAAEPEGGVHLVVADTGAGIPADQLDAVFDRFAQVDGSTTRQHEGTGIGLSLVQELVSLHGGRAWAESEGLGRGTRMHVVLPPGEADRADEEEVLLSSTGGRALTAAGSFRGLASEISLDLEAPVATPGVAPAPAAADAGLAELALPEHPPETPEVVIAEDNAEMRRLLCLLIGREFRVRPARNGREALALVREREPDLVVTDVMMPELSGTELCRAIKQDPATRAVPVMLVTSKAEREMKIEGLELGADDYVTKPFHPRELLARTRALVRVRRLQREVEERNRSLAEGNEALARALRELKEAEVQLVQAERLAAVGELAAGVAHEVNNPLNFARNSLATLRGYVADLRAVAERVAALDPGQPEEFALQLEALERDKTERQVGELSSALDELVAIVTEGLDRTARLVADLRDFAAPHRGREGAVDVAAGLRSTIELLRHRLRDVGARLEWVPPAGLPPLQGDAGAINQVFLNLLKNAADAIEGDGGTIRVAAYEDGPWLVVEVRDDGPGIPPEIRARLFEPFFTTKPAGAGTGLGLSMSRRIVDEHGGRIEVASEPGQGTCVTVRLPLERPRAATAGEEVGGAEA